MAATPEEFPGNGDHEPFSPSVFLDLPPTPRSVGDGEDPAASSEDLVLSFIERMLMEEEIEDRSSYHYPDHPALLQVQQPYAQILSDAAAAAANNHNDGSGGCTLSPSSDGNGVFQSAGGSPGIESWGLLNGAEKKTTMTTTDSLPTGDWEHGAAPSTVLSGQSRDMIQKDMINQAFLRGMEEAKKFLPTDSSLGQTRDMVQMDMINQAFLRGMEEAKQFLPTNTSLLVEARGSKRSQGFTAGDVGKEDKVDVMLIFQGIGNGQGHKNQCNWQDLETETGRNSKLMVPEQEDTGEIIDELIINEYRLCLNGMPGLRITMDGEDGMNIRKGIWKSVLGRQSLSEAVDLRTMLVHCAEAVSIGDRSSAVDILKRIKQHSSPRGDANQRLAHYFAEGLDARLAGTGSQVYKSLMSKRTSRVEFLKAYKLYLTVCCFKMMVYKFSNMTIVNVSSGRKKLHIVDYGIHHGIQWPSLLGLLSTREGGPPEVRITGIDLPLPGFRPAAQIEETGRRLSKCARQFGVPFKFQSIISANWEMVSVDDLNIDPDEVLIVNGLYDFGNLMDEGVHSPSPRDVVLSSICKMRPAVFIHCNANVYLGATFFAARFREAMFFVSTLFDMLDATIPRDSDQRLLVERDLIGRFALNVIACEGSDRVERHETYKQWQLRSHRAGLRQLPLDPDIVKAVRKKAEDSYHKDFIIDVDHQWLLEGWKGRITCAMSTWVADDAFSEH